jgi:hypothetical protein
MRPGKVNKILICVIIILIGWMAYNQYLITQNIDLHRLTMEVMLDTQGMLSERENN